MLISRCQCISGLKFRSASVAQRGGQGADGGHDLVTAGASPVPPSPCKQHRDSDAALDEVADRRAAVLATMRSPSQRRGMGRSWALVGSAGPQHPRPGRRRRQRRRSRRGQGGAGVGRHRTLLAATHNPRESGWRGSGEGWGRRPIAKRRAAPFRRPRQPARLSAGGGRGKGHGPSGVHTWYTRRP
jgi:hypothetical protein